MVLIMKKPDRNQVTILICDLVFLAVCLGLKSLLPTAVRILGTAALALLTGLSFIPEQKLKAPLMKILYGCALILGGAAVLLMVFR